MTKISQPVVKWMMSNDLMSKEKLDKRVVSLLVFIGTTKIVAIWFCF